MSDRASYKQVTGKLDLIDRQAAIEVASRECHELRGIFSRIEHGLKELPSAEPERKKGKWLEFPNHMTYKCSECGRIIQTTNGRRNVSKHYPFCHCGADMRGDRQ